MEILPALEKWGVGALIAGYVIKKTFELLQGVFGKKGGDHGSKESPDSLLVHATPARMETADRVGDAIMEISRQSVLQTRLLQECVEGHERNREAIQESAHALTRIETKLDVRHAPPNGRGRA